MKAEVGQYVKAVYDFNTIEKGEITLKEGDIILVSAAVDDNWLCGRLGDREGIFPSSFVEKINVPTLKNGQKLFRATENFPSQVDGDLEIRKGEIILGLQRLDSNWWKGQVNNRIGLFPLTHAVPLDTLDLLPVQSTESHKSSWHDSGVSVSTGSGANKSVEAKALVDSTAQLDEELGFRKGEIIRVTEVIDSDWFRGECNGKSGIFLSDCVQVMGDLAVLCTGHPPLLEQRTRSLSRTTGLSFDDQPHSIERGRSGSSSSVGTPRNRSASNSLDNRNRSASYNSENTRSRDNEVTPYAKTLYPFSSQAPNELTFMDNEIVTLIKHVDNEWIEGEIDGKFGLFPASFVEIIVDCPYVYDDEDETMHLRADVIDGPSHHNARLSESIIEEESEHTEEQYGLVLYDFTAESTKDLNMREGDTIIVLRKIDKNWLEAKDESGNVGMCPIQFVEIIGAEPKPDVESKSTAVDKENKTVADSRTSSQHSMKPNGVVFRSFEEIKNKENNNRFKRNSTSDTHNSSNLQQSITSEKPCTQPRNICLTKPKPILKPKPDVKPKPTLAPKPMTKEGKLPASRSRPNSTELSDVGVQSLDMLIKEELLKASDEATRSRSSSVQSNASTGSGGAVYVTGSSAAPSSTASALSGSNSALTGSDSALSGSDSALSGSNSTLTCSNSVLKGSNNSTIHIAGSTNAGSSSYIGTPPSAGCSVFDSSRVQNGPDIHNSVPKRTETPFSDSFLVPAEKPEKPTPVLRNITRDSVFYGSRGNINKAYINDAMEFDWDQGLPKKSVGQSTFFVDYLGDLSEPKTKFPPRPAKRSAPTRRPPAPPSKVVTVDENIEEMSRKPSLRKPPPPRPTGPRVASAPPKSPLIPQCTYPTMKTDLPQISTRPSRPAPPRPAPSQGNTPPRRPAPIPRSPTDLMSFSPHSTIPGENQAVLDLQSRIEELEKDLEKCTKSKSELELMLTKVDDEDKEEIEENLEFYQANVNGLTQELAGLRDKLQQVHTTEAGDSETSDAAALQQQRETQESQRLELEEERKRREEEEAKKHEERRRKRERVIEELLQTEKDYLMYLQLCVESFLGPEASRVPSMDTEVLFGNMEEIADVAQKLLTRLEGAVSGQEFNKQVIGSCFVELSEDMKNAYAPYCRNHDDVQVLLEKYEENPTIQEHVEKVLDNIRLQANVFDLGSLLIKPVQRILKYPLLLNELLKTTEEDHDDKTELMKSINAMTGVATAINEYKRRKDLVFKYKKDTDAKFGEKIARLNLHSLRKKSARLKGRLSTNLGISLQTKDENFTKHEARFRGMDKFIRTFVKNVEMYIEQLQDSIMLEETVAADIADYYDKKSIEEVEKYQTALKQFSTDIFGDFKTSVEDLVIVPLNRLMSMFDGPTNVIQKRFDKLLDYDSIYRKTKDVDKTKAVSDALQAAKNDYEAMNAQLLDELPKLHQLSFSLLKDCMGVFVRVQKDFTDHILKGMYPLMELPLLLASGESLMETFNIKHVPALDKISSYTFVPKGFNPRVEPSKPEKRSSKRHSLDPAVLRTPTSSPGSVNVLPAVASGSPQNDSQRVYIVQKYTPEKTFRVIHSYSALNVMDISVQEGDVVGIIKESDPMGDKGRWFVDVGEAKGFVPRKFLALHSPPRISTSSLHPSVSDSLLTDADFDAIMESECQVDWSTAHSPPSSHTSELYPPLPEEPPPPYPDEFYYAEYGFAARNTNEVSLFEGQVVSIINKHDLDGNTEWWWVDADGHQGFAPSAYLKKIEENIG